MRLSKAFIPTLKETPSEAEVKSHRLMLRAGMIRMHVAGVYCYLPLGRRVLRNIERIVREEMDRIGAQEFLLPTLSRRDLWERTGRWTEYGDDMFRLKDRKNADLALAPTHEEVFSEIAAGEIRSYRDLPQTWYQIQMKFRDEPRPRSGLLRGRQFTMKDAYSFDRDREGLDQSYAQEREAYHRILARCGLDFVTVRAFSGLMGGSDSEEFMVPSEAGEDRIARCKSCGYAANIEVAVSVSSPVGSTERELSKVATPSTKTIDQVSSLLGIGPSGLMKSLLFMADENPVMVLVRGDYAVSEAKLEKVLGAAPRPAEPDEVLKFTGAHVGFVGPVGLSGVEIIADEGLRGQHNLTTGANEDDYHQTGIEIGRDFEVTRFADVRAAAQGDTCGECGNVLTFGTAIEVGHIFKLGTRYSEAIGATFSDAAGEDRPLVMGSYGIGIERIAASVIEQRADEDGIVWPISIAPYHVHLLPVNVSDANTMKVAEALYEDLGGRGVEVLMDDREERAGVKFKDADLLGLPIRITIGARALAEGNVEIKPRNSPITQKVPQTEIMERTLELIREMEQEFAL
ncbi:MAG: proline--tRNA ligase [Candidatus Latescibacterota bacterium]